MNRSNVIAMLLACILCSVWIYFSQNTDAPGYVSTFKIWLNAPDFWGIETKLFDRNLIAATPIWLLLLAIQQKMGVFLFGHLSGVTELLWFKAPSFIALILAGVFALKKRMTTLNTLQIVAFVLNPLLLHNAAITGDWAVFKLLLILGLNYALINRQYLVAGMLTGVFTAFSGLIVVLVPWIFAVLIKNQQQQKNSFLDYFIAAILSFLLFFMPFFPGHSADIFAYFNLFDTPVQFSSNEFNLFAALGLNLRLIENSFVPWFFATTAFAFLIFLWIKKSSNKNFDTNAFGVVSVLSISLFVPGMPALSSVAALPFLYFLGIKQSNRSYKFFAQYILLSFILLIEQIYVFDGTRFARLFWELYKTVPLQWRSPTVTICSIAKLIVLINAVRFIWLTNKEGTKPASNSLPRTTPDSAGSDKSFLNLTSFSDKFPFKKFDFIGMSTLLICALALNFYHLGSDHWYQSKHFGSSTTKIKVQNSLPVHGMWILKNHEKVSYEVTCENNPTPQKLSPPRASSYTWNYHELKFPCEKSFEVTIKGSKKSVTYEILLSSNSQGIFQPTDFCLHNTSGECLAPQTSKLFDEPHSSPPTSYDAGYYDEFFNIATGIVLIDEGVIPQFGTAHPYLGRFMVTKSMQFLGVNPFGWRFPAAFFGALLPILVFFLARELFSSRYIAYGSGLLFLLDSQRIGISRVANVDTQLVFWITLGFIFVVRFIRANANVPLNNKSTRLFSGWPSLLLASLCLGAATATKWIGVFAFLGAFCTIFLFGYFKALRKGAAYSSGNIRWIPEKSARLLATVGLGILASGAVILTIYVATYLPLVEVKSFSETLSNIINHQFRMLNMHTGAIKFHPYKSIFLSWTFIDMPMGMHAQKGLDPGLNQFIFLLGNPVVYWSMIPAFFIIFTNKASIRSIPVLLLILAISSQLLPWIFVHRNLFNYHFLSASVFATIAVAYVIFNFSFTRRAQIIYFLAAIISLIVYWPLIAGLPISDSYLQNVSLFSNWFVPFDWTINFK